MATAAITIPRPRPLAKRKTQRAPTSLPPWPASCLPRQFHDSLSQRLGAAEAAVVAEAGSREIDVGFDGVLHVPPAADHHLSEWIDQVAVAVADAIRAELLIPPVHHVV